MSQHLDSHAVLVIPVDLIDPMPDQPRSYFHPEGIRLLAESILTIGQLQPGAVRPVGSRYQLIDGERRLRACQLAGIRSYRAIVVMAVENDEMQFDLSTAANFGNEPLSTLEKARAIWRMHSPPESPRLSAEEIARRLQCTPGSVYQYLGLRRLDKSVLALMDARVPEFERLTFSVAYEISINIENPEVQLEVAQKITSLRMRLGQAKHLIKQKADKETSRRPANLPYRRYSIFKRLLTRFKGDLGVWVKASPKEIGAMLAGHKEATPKVVKFLRGIQEDLDRLIKVLEREGN